MRIIRASDFIKTCFSVFRLKMRERQAIMLTDRINERKGEITHIKRIILFSENEIKEIKAMKKSDKKVFSKTTP